MKTWKEMDRLFNSVTENRIICKCGHRMNITNKYNKLVCNYCGRTVFKDKKTEFITKLKENINKQKREGK